MSIKVLICDDVADFRILLKLWLDSRGDMITVGEAGTGVEAVDLTSALSPDVVLLDINLPGMDGFAALEDILRESPDTKVIMLTGLERQYQLASLAFELGATDFVEKGSSLDEITDRVRSAVMDVRRESRLPILVRDVPVDRTEP